MTNKAAAHSSVLIRTELKQALAEYLPTGTALCVAFSGGLDSLVLLHALTPLARAYPLRAIHIDHGLQADSEMWAETCVAIATQIGVACTAIKVHVDVAGGKGIESAARDARYAALRDALQPGEVVVTAHHQRDQVETLLLQLLRGAGVHGLAAMPAFRVDNGLPVFRPLLQLAAEEIRAYAEQNALQWIEDPSNAALDIDRNYMRHEVLPLLRRRWPALEKTVARSSRLCSEAADIIDEIARADLQQLLFDNQLDLPGLALLEEGRQRNAFRFALRSLGLPVPSEAQLKEALEALLKARPDGQPEASWPGVRVRRFRNRAWFFDDQHDPRSATAGHYDWLPENSIDMGAVRGKLSAEFVPGKGIATDFIEQPLKVCFRKGGEKIRPGIRGRTRLLKNLLQESDIVPWMRGNIPLVYSGDRLLAVADIWVNAEFAASGEQPGMRVIWRNHAALR